jgi:hypothetical protein
MYRDTLKVNLYAILKTVSFILTNRQVPLGLNCLKDEFETNLSVYDFNVVRPGWGLTKRTNTQDVF